MAIVSLLLSNIFFYSLYMNIFSVLVPLAAAEWGMNSSSIGLLVSMGGVLILVCNIPLATIADKYGKKKIILPGVFLSFVSVILLIMFPTIPGLVISYILFRIASILQFIPTLAFLSIIPSRFSQAQIQGINGFIQGISMIIGSLLAGFLKDHIGITATNYLLLILIGISMLCLIFVTEEKPHPNDKTEKISIKSSFSDAIHMILSNRNIQKAAIIEVTNTILFGSAFAAFYPIYVTNLLGFSATFLGITIALRSIISTLMSLTYPFLSKRFGKFAPVCILLIIGGGAIFILPSIKTQIMLLVLNCVIGISLGVIPAAPNTLIGEGCSVETRAMGYASVEIIYGFVSSVIPFFLGLLADRYEMTIVFRVSGIMGIVFIALVVIQAELTKLKEK